MWQYVIARMYVRHCLYAYIFWKQHCLPSRMYQIYQITQIRRNMFDMIFLLDISLNIFFHKNMLNYIFKIILHSYNYFKPKHFVMAWKYICLFVSFYSFVPFVVFQFMLPECSEYSYRHLPCIVTKYLKNANPMQENTSFLCLSHVKLCMELTTTKKKCFFHK
jgi:hypothetical protein